MNCQFISNGPTQVKCIKCNKIMPKIPGWQSLQRNCSGLVALPGAVKQIWNFARTSAFAAAGGLASGSLLSTAEMSGERLAICFDCDKYRPSDKRCSECGCFVEAKSKIAIATCPINKWDAIHAKSILPYGGDIIRHLLMFIYPKPGPEWSRNIEQISRRIELFNGRKIIAIATDSHTEDISTVVDALSLLECEVLQFENKIGEVVAFKTLLESVKSEDPRELVFYCHAKGVTKQGTPGHQSIQRWTDAMYEVLLDGYSDVEERLKSHTFAGAFRAIGRQFGNLKVPFFNWHYPGTFYWFRSADIFSRPQWGNIQQQYYGTEAWPGTMVPISRSVCLLADNVPLAALYDPDQWTAKYQGVLDRWRDRKAAADVGNGSGQA